MQPGTDKLQAKAARALAAAEAALEAGAADVAAGRAFYALLYAAKARLNETGLRLRTHARIAAAYAALPGFVEPRFRRVEHGVERAPGGDVGGAVVQRRRRGGEGARRLRLQLVGAGLHDRRLAATAR